MITQSKAKFGLVSVSLAVASFVSLQSCRSTETGSAEKSTDSQFDPNGYQSIAQKFFANYGLIPQKGFLANPSV